MRELERFATLWTHLRLRLVPDESQQQIAVVTLEQDAEKPVTHAVHLLTPPLSLLTHTGGGKLEGRWLPLLASGRRCFLIPGNTHPP